MQNRKGSILEEFGLVTNIGWCTQTSLRRSLEPSIQGNEVMRTRSKSIAQHSAATGSKHYDRTEPEFRAAAMHYIGTQDGSNVPSTSRVEITEEVAAKRARLEEEDNNAKISQALENVQKSKKRNFTLGKNCKLLPEDREFLQNAFSKGGKFGQFLAPFEKFPSKYLLVSLVLK